MPSAASAVSSTVAVFASRSTATLATPSTLSSALVTLDEHPSHIMPSTRAPRVAARRARARRRAAGARARARRRAPPRARRRAAARAAPRRHARRGASPRAHRRRVWRAAAAHASRTARVCWNRMESQDSTTPPFV